jgi:hypothetical protein
MRRELAAWSVGIATNGEDYVVNGLGDRYYSSAKAEQLILPLLEEIGLDVGHEIGVRGDC